MSPHLDMTAKDHTHRLAAHLAWSRSCRYGNGRAMVETESRPASRSDPGHPAPPWSPLLSKKRCGLSPISTVGSPTSGVTSLSRVPLRWVRRSSGGFVPMRADVRGCLGVADALEHTRVAAAA